ncbi:uncharacterized protein G2W53_005605 [Senna tora]|uniref:Uncharacterized protein n=1 Tax=Senna tora TaxID=362788 RepID=A0A834X2P8_9FABA|nr:uncharacterized protein G2W53_005605 [Senna tora]
MKAEIPPSDFSHEPPPLLSFSLILVMGTHMSCKNLRRIIDPQRSRSNSFTNFVSLDFIIIFKLSDVNTERLVDKADKRRALALTISSVLKMLGWNTREAKARVIGRDPIDDDWSSSKIEAWDKREACVCREIGGEATIEEWFTSNIEGRQKRKVCVHMATRTVGIGKDPSSIHDWFSTSIEGRRQKRKGCVYGAIGKDPTIHDRLTTSIDESGSRREVGVSVVVGAGIEHERHGEGWGEN